MARKYTFHNRKEAPRHLTIPLGSINDSLDHLKQLCNDKSVELLKSIELNEDNTLDVVFWTEDIPELIAVSHFIKDEKGNVSFRLDFDICTL